MVRCPVCGKSYTNSTALLKHIRLKSRFDKAHEMLWREFQEFVDAVADEDLKHLGKTELFRKFLELKYNGGLRGAVQMPQIQLPQQTANTGGSGNQQTQESSRQST